MPLGCRSRHSSDKKDLAAEEESTGKERIVLRVEDAVYRESDFEKYVRAQAGEDYDTLEVSALSLLFDKFVEEKVLLQAARGQNITLTEEEKLDFLDKISGEAWTEEEKEALLGTDSGPLYEKMLIDKYIYLLVKDLTIDAGDIRQYYELHRRDFILPERFEVSQILLPAEAKAVEVLEKVRYASEGEYRQVAREESIGPEAPMGGKMGVFQMGQLPFELERAIFSLREGELSPIVESSYGYHIFRLDRKYEAEWISFEEATPSIRLKIIDQKAEEAVTAHVRELQGKLGWNANPLNLPFPYQRED